VGLSGLCSDFSPRLDLLAEISSRKSGERITALAAPAVRFDRVEILITTRRDGESGERTMYSCDHMFEDLCVKEQRRD